ncbi:MAG: YraN family protein [Enterobacterales bacterium]|nr:YraN family protein [Enterobacterales bacterium]
MSSRSIGQQTEQLARDFLQVKGLRFIASNINYPFGELDLVMQDGDYLVFIEVRYRARADYGSALESVTRKKRQRITKAAQAYLQQEKLWQRCDCRFDLVTLSGQLSKPSIEWFKNPW